MAEGRSHVVYLYLDPNKRVISSTRLHKFLDERAKNMAPGDDVDLLIVNQTDMGYKAVVNGSHLGLLYKDEVPFQSAIPDSHILPFRTATFNPGPTKLRCFRHRSQAMISLS